jgi:trimethylamine:corrinoid methyltransferase-like protein
MDVEIFEYVKELMESFDPHPDLLSTDGMYQVLWDAATGQEQFYGHPDTAEKAQNIFPISKRRSYRKLRAWMADKQNLVDRARAECRERIRNQEPFRLDEDRHRELDRIYQAGEKALLE